MSRSLLNPGSSGHSLMPRGLAAGAIDGVRNGRFDRLIPATAHPAPEDAALQALAKFMVTSFDEKGPAVDKDGKPKPDRGKPINTGEVADENASIDAAYTYFGQFVDHDLTLDPAGFGQSQKDVSGTVDFRTPALDLDCLYGGGPADQPSMYANASNGARHLLRLGKPVEGAGPGNIRHDLLRLPAVSATDSAHLAVIGDKRNDENKIVAQFQATMISLHNKIYEDSAFHPGITDVKDRFDNTVRLVRWHYQWVVLHDFLLGHLLMPGAMKPLGSIYHPHLPLYDSVMAKGRDYPFMPVEFSGGVYRLGHSMVRPSYSLSGDNIHKGDSPRIDTFAAAGPDLRGFGVPITPDWLIDWGYFIGGVTPRKHNADYVLPQPSYRIDTRVGNPLSILPEFKDETIRIQANLAYRNLSRGVGLGLPSGEEMASALNIKPMTPAQVWSAGSKDYRDDAAKSEIHSRRKAINDHKFAAHFSEGTPLWYYVLREAEYYGCTRELPAHYLKAKGVKEDVKGSQQENINFGGQHLGPVGSRVVLETFLGMLWHDRRSFLHDATWRPHHRLNPAGEFTLGKLIHFALA